MADPEGGEFCAFVRAEPPPYRLYELGLDAADARSVGRWWADLLGCGWQAKPLDETSVDREAGEPGNDGGHSVDEGGEFVSVADIPGAPFVSLDVAPVPEPKSGKNRVHLDVVGDVAEIVACGGTVLGEQPRWTVMADVEGNEFCVFPPA
ncbi:MAG: VOC family protein [Pseudonocardia sp.]|nr:VOC family protein [Pseudonocardia sp.]